MSCWSSDLALQAFGIGSSLTDGIGSSLTDAVVNVDVASNGCLPGVRLALFSEESWSEVELTPNVAEKVAASLMAAVQYARSRP